MSDNGGVTDHDHITPHAGTDELIERLADADPAEAPAVAEELTDRLTRELDSTRSSEPPAAETTP